MAHLECVRPPAPPSAGSQQTLPEQSCIFHTSQFLPPPSRPSSQKLRVDASSRPPLTDVLGQHHPPPHIPARRPDAVAQPRSFPPPLPPSRTRPPRTVAPTCGGARHPGPTSMSETQPERRAGPENRPTLRGDALTADAMRK